MGWFPRVGCLAIPLKWMESMTYGYVRRSRERERERERWSHWERNNQYNMCSERISQDRRNMSRTVLEDWSAIQWLMGWCQRVDSSTRFCSMERESWDIMEDNEPNQRHNESKIRDWNSVVQVNEIGQRSNGWWNGAIELIRVQVSAITQFDQAQQVSDGRTCHFWEMLHIQVLKIDERSKGRRNGSRELIRLQLTVHDNSNQVHWVSDGRDCHFWEMLHIQSLKIDERSKGRRNGSRELIRLQLTFSTIPVSDTVSSVSEGTRVCNHVEIKYRTCTEDWSEIQSPMKWYHWVDSSTAL